MKGFGQNFEGVGQNIEDFCQISKILVEFSKQKISSIKVKRMSLVKINVLFRLEIKGIC